MTTMIWADRIAIVAFLLVALLTLLLWREPTMAMGLGAFLGGAVWLSARALDFLFTGRIRLATA